MIEANSITHVFRRGKDMTEDFFEQLQTRSATTARGQPSRTFKRLYLGRDARIFHKTETETFHGESGSLQELKRNREDESRRLPARSIQESVALEDMDG